MAPCDTGNHTYKKDSGSEGAAAPAVSSVVPLVSGLDVLAK